MNTIIEKHDWHFFLESFGRLHKNWLINMEENRTIVLENQPLQELHLEDLRLCVRAGQFTAYIQNPVSLKLLRTKEGADHALEIETDHGLTTLSITQPTLPEMVDGYLA